MGKLKKQAAECDCKEYDRELIEQFMHGLGNGGMISEILRETSVMEDINYVTSER